MLLTAITEDSDFGQLSQHSVDGRDIVALSASEARQFEAINRALGPRLLGYLKAKDVIEIMANPDGTLWVERQGHEMECVGDISKSEAENLIFAVAGACKTLITTDSPILECELPFDGSRFEALIPPVVSRPTFSIRRRATIIYTLDDYVKTEVMTDTQRQAIVRAICPLSPEDHKKNILVVGGTGTGKTTFVNAILDCIATNSPNDRLVIIEDTAELQCRAKNVALLRSNSQTSMLALLKATLRLRPDRIGVGEVRGPESLALLKAWNTGHPGGVATIHANDARAGLHRLEGLVAEATSAPQQAMIAEAVNLVVVIGKSPEGRRIREIVEVSGWDGKTYITQPIEG